MVLQVHSFIYDADCDHYFDPNWCSEYLEEFAPKNFLTDIIEVKTLRLFLQLCSVCLVQPFLDALTIVGSVCWWFGTKFLPTVIITTRASLKAVPPSKLHLVWGLQKYKPFSIMFGDAGDHDRFNYWCCTRPTAPLLLIGMSAFVASIPTLIKQLLYLFKFTYGRVMKLLRRPYCCCDYRTSCINLNSLAIWLRKKFEVRW